MRQPADRIPSAPGQNDTSRTTGIDQLWSIQTAPSRADDPYPRRGLNAGCREQPISEGPSISTVCRDAATACHSAPRTLFALPTRLDVGRCAGIGAHVRHIDRAIEDENACRRLDQKPSRRADGAEPAPKRPPRVRATSDGPPALARRAQLRRRRYPRFGSVSARLIEWYLSTRASADARPTPRGSRATARLLTPVVLRDTGRGPSAHAG